MSITEIAIKRPLLILVVFFTLILFGVISYNSLNYNLLPKMDIGVLTVTSTYRGASADEIQSNITKPLEDALSAMEGVKHISSTSREGVSTIQIELKPGVNTIIAQSDAERKVNAVKSALPIEADAPVVNRLDIGAMPILRIGTSANLSQTKLYDLVNQQIKPLLSNVNGVGNVNLIGGNQREIEVVLDNEKLSAYNLSASQVNQAVGNANISYPAGVVESASSRFSLRLNEKFENVEDLRNLVISRTKDGGRILLNQVASVTDGQSEDMTINRINGRPSIGIEIIKQADANAVEVSGLVKQKLEELKIMHTSENLDFEIANDQSVSTLASADAVTHDLILAVMIVALVILVFLHSMRSSFFILVALPSAMIPTFILMYAFGFSLNLMTLMALSLVVGILVDDSIVVLENIFRHMEMGKDKRVASIEGRSEIGFTAFAITLVDIVVFVPMAMGGGIIGNILREFSLVVVFSTLMSLLVSFTLTPLLASRFAKLDQLTKSTLWGKISLSFEKLLDVLKHEYGKLIGWALGHKRWVLLGISALFIASIMLFFAGLIGASFMSPGDSGELNITLEMASETPLYQTNQAVLQAEKIILARPEVTKVFSNVGVQSGQSGNANAGNIAELSLKLVDKEQRSISSVQFGELMRNEISRIPGLKVSVKPVDLISGNTDDAPIQVVVRGTDMEDIWAAAKTVKDIIAKTPGTDYVEYSTKNPQSEVNIDIDRDKMNMVGLSLPELGGILQLAFRGNNRLKYSDKGQEYAIKIISDKADRQNIESVRNITIRNSRGENIRLADIATITEKMGQSVLQRSDRLNSITITAFSAGRPTGTITEEIKSSIDNQKLPEGITVDYMGEAKNQDDGFGSLLLAMLIGFLLVYLIMVALYESIVYPFVVMFSIPVALIGAFLALALTMESLTIFAMVGLIMLMGLVAKNGILIVDFTNHLKTQGYQLKDALVEAGKERLRPILMTTVAMIFGMLPMALANGPGSEITNGMAWVIIGGLTSSLFLTLLLVPTMYYLVDKAKEKIGGVLKRGQATLLKQENIAG